MPSSNLAGNSPIRITAVNQFLKWLWIAGLVIWAATVWILLWHLPEAQTYAQASFNSRRLEFVSLFGVFWAVAPAIWQARHKTMWKREI
jgi:hypothetical protein